MVSTSLRLERSPLSRQLMVETTELLTIREMSSVKSE